ncbi:MAG: hypothetical protein IH914_00330 [candidate division Zixibacteria bacterium]|nr:hypothetical protein [candidate division Zixibacteria bacterium]
MKEQKKSHCQEAMSELDSANLVFAYCWYKTVNHQWSDGRKTGFKIVVSFFKLKEIAFMDSPLFIAIISAIIGAIIGAIAHDVVSTIAARLRRKVGLPQDTKTKPQPPVVFENTILPLLELNDTARSELRKSRFIGIDGTGEALMNLVNSVGKKEGYSLLALCGNKGPFAKEYYDLNFNKCTTVKRIFRFDAIQEEKKTNTTRITQDGLKQHLDMIISPPNEKRKVNVYLIKRVEKGTFNPPPSFGFAILLNKRKKPMGAVMHWEMSMKPLKHLVNIVGIEVKETEQNLLNELVALHSFLITISENIANMEDFTNTYATFTEENEANR